MTETTQDIILRGKLMWPKLFKPEPTYGRFETNLLLDADNLKIAQENGLRIKKNEEWGTLFEGYDGSYVKSERNSVSRDGKPIEAPDVYTAKVQPITKEIGIGNGTDATVKSMVKTLDMTGKFMSPAVAMQKHKGYGLYLKAVMIRNLVPYGSDESKDFVEEDGSFVISDDQKKTFDFVQGDDLPFDPE